MLQRVHSAGDHAALQDLLGVNVIGTIVAWGLMLLTLLENPFASTLMFDNLQGNNFVQVCAEPHTFPTGLPLRTQQFCRKHTFCSPRCSVMEIFSPATTFKRQLQSFACTCLIG